MNKFFLCFLIAAAVFFVTCKYPIFYTISLEEEKLEPKIPGSPTNFAVFNGNLYVASGGTLFIYEKTDPAHRDRGIWHEITPGGNIFALADAGGFLYILCEESDKKVLKRSINGRDFNAVVVQIGDAVHNNILSIYSANNMLFLGAGSFSSLNILFFNGDNFQMLVENAGRMLLNGAAFNGASYYLSAKDLANDYGGGIYTCTDPLRGATLINNDSSKPFVGIINLGNNTIVAIAQTGILFDVQLKQGVSLASGSKSYMATGALAVWENENGKLLLAGRQDALAASTSTGYTYGYMELNITSGGVSGNFREPGLDDVSTVIFEKDGNEKYKSSIGKFPVNNIIQYTENDGRKTLFASTQKDGVYSYRQRDGESWSWNAEQ